MLNIVKAQLSLSCCECFALILCYQIHTIAIIAEGIPEALTRKLIKSADEKGVTIIGPATVSVLKWLRICIAIQYMFIHVFIAEY